MAVNLDSIKALRELTGAGIMDCKEALEKAAGDLKMAQDILREKGFAAAAKKLGRETKQGLVEAYIHSGGRIASLVELNCETDFVARTPEFKDLAHSIAMQVAAMDPKYVSLAEVPAENGLKPEEVALLAQPFIKDPTRTVQDLVTEFVSRVGENIRVRRFIRFSLGE
ncbi:MAG: translation elongation factor Ts [Chloroflexi bacterium]|nr:translation elongation factor Ts [Chloroflexota bacterium]